MDWDIEAGLDLDDVVTFDAAPVAPGCEPIFDQTCVFLADLEAVQQMNPLMVAQLAFS